MAFEKIKDQLKDNWADLNAKIQENSTFNNVREKFESQTPTVQRAIIFAATALIALFLLSFPWGYLNDSQDHMAAFEENRGLIEGLLRAARSAKEPSPLPTPTPAEALKTRIEALLHENRLVPEQIGEIQPLPGTPAKEFAPPVVIQTGVAVQMKKLNVEQVISISQQLQSLGLGTKLMGLDVSQSAGQTHYYDVIARVVNFALPAITSIEPDEALKGKKGSAAKRPARKAEEEGGE